MNLKKFISGVSALTIAASAFAAMAVTASAETSTLLEYGTAEVAWTEDGVAAWTAGGNPTLADGVVTISGGDASYVTSTTITPTENSIIDVEAVVRLKSNTGRTFVQGNGSYFRFGNIVVAQNDQDKKHGYTFSGLDNIGSATTFTAGDYRTDIANMPWLKITMQINTATDTLTSFDVTSEDGTTTYASASNVALSDADYSTVAFGFRRSGRISTTNTEQLKSIKITETTQEVQTADYTIRHVGPDNVQVKEDQTKTSVVGTEIILSDSDKADVAGQYYYVSDDSADKTVAADGSTVVTVTYRAATPYSATVTAKNGEDTLKVFNGSSVDETANARVYYTKYINSGDKYYVTDANASYPSYAKDFSAEGNADVTYKAADEDVLFASEIEDLKPSRSWAANGAVSERYSNGGARRLYSNSNVPVWTAELKSTITVSLWSRNQASKNTESINVYLKDADGNLAETPVAAIGEWAAGAMAEMTSAEFVVPTGYTVVIVNDTEYNSNLEMDYVVIKGKVAPKADYTVNYVSGETIVKTVTLSGVVDDAPELAEADKADFVVEDQKYIYVSDDSADKTVAADGSTVVTVTVRAAAAYAVTVNGGNTELAKLSVFEGDSAKYSYPKYITDDSKKVTYVADGTTFTQTVAPTEDTVITVPYTAYVGTAYFADHEKITSTAALDSGNYSNGYASRAENDGVEAFTVAEAGTYDITVAASCRNTNNPSVFAVYKNEVTEENLIFTGDVKGTSQNTVQTSGIKTITGVELKAGDVIIIQGDNGNTWVDYVMAVQTAAAAPEIQTTTIVIGDADGNGKINAIDINRIKKYITNGNVAGKGTGNAGQIKTTPDNSTVVIGDTSGDNKINAIDINRIKKYITSGNVAGKGTGNTGNEVEVIDETSTN